ncbi:cell division protein FtsI (penicillin-binding protein 3) [Breoghania corrubedonensis]|uniref:Cell division protein FtsI (Penicillin-binding protein 3) n=1 Tax=Breoghania corrubedonensis TaxID=665038 RepID=A0A2T5V4Z2_9HYPH|nr:penicillin-binding protein 2 [Breoghania corrubedonensis]PTW58814.1 cell division protein FtsI (penicillin-binding protein 3) [Breoghania corrubedonensis]
MSLAASDFSPLAASARSRAQAPRVSAVVSRSMAEDAGTPGRVVVVMAVFALLYGLIALRLIDLGMSDETSSSGYIGAQQAILAARPDLVDRNGELLATDIKAPSVYAEPRKIVDVDEAIDKLSSVLPELGSDAMRKRLESDAGFIWLKREITPLQREAIHRLGIPGIGFLTENRRFYPGGPTAGHIVGIANVDEQGIAGLEKYLDGQGIADLQHFGFATDQALKPVRLSMDLRVQHVVRDELSKAMERYKAIASVGIVLDVHTGEVMAMSSLPDYDPNDPGEALKPENLNRATAGVYEMGSVFKSFSIAMALDSGKVTLDSKYDATKPIRIGGFTIHDFHGTRRVLTVPEIFVHSSNIGTAKMTLDVGIDQQEKFFKRIGLLDKVDTELPEVAAPLLPRKWSEITAMTASYGHGISVSPMQTAVAGVALINGGMLIEPTFFPRTATEAAKGAKRVISKRVSDMMRYLFRLNAVEGSGRNARVAGYMVGGKTGTADKVVDGRYAHDRRRNSFLAAFPMDDPQYLVLVVLDEPKPEEGKYYATAGMNAAPTVSKIIARIAPMLGVVPHMSEDSDTTLVSY